LREQWEKDGDFEAEEWERSEEGRGGVGVAGWDLRERWEGGREGGREGMPMRNSATDRPSHDRWGTKEGEGEGEGGRDGDLGIRREGEERREEGRDEGGGRSDPSLRLDVTEAHLLLLPPSLPPSLPSLPPSPPSLTSTKPFRSFLFSGSLKNTHVCLPGIGTAPPPSLPPSLPPSPSPFVPPRRPWLMLSLLRPRGVHLAWMARRSSRVREGGKQRAGRRKEGGREREGG